jgi:hypothetical protein
MSFGNKLGRGLGVIGALAVEGAVRGATGLGQFGSDVVDGAQTGYDEKHAALLITRAAREAKIKALMEERRVAAQVAMNALTMPVVAEPAVAKRVAGRAKV